MLAPAVFLTNTTRVKCKGLDSNVTTFRIFTGNKKRQVITHTNDTY